MSISDRLKTLNQEGRRLNDDSSQSEKTLNQAMESIIAYARDLFQPHATIEHVKTMSLYECQQYFHKVGGPVPNPDNKRVYMKPDGGILLAVTATERIPILIVEDKVQGTNDILHKQKKKRQSTGNAIERGAKNIRGAEMLFSGLDIFPYVMFASGCDFHYSETISKRIEMMNMGVPNHYINIAPNKLPTEIEQDIERLTEQVNINKVNNRSIASVFIKAHKWNEMPHGSSAWGKQEIITLCKKVLALVAESPRIKSLLKV
jgi:hypothetical protein